MFISSKPTLTLEMLWGKGCSSLKGMFPFSNGRCEFFYSARYALAAAIDALNLAPHQSILMPAYTCGVEVEPLVRQGVKIDWYRVNRDFVLDEDDLVGHIGPETAAVFVIHYLGFPQRLETIRRICTERGIVLIEDCAHGLLSNDGDVPLGSMGDMAIFSPRKTFPIPDGGCLVLNNPAITVRRDGRDQPNYFATYFVLSEMLAGGTSTKTIGAARLGYLLNLAVAQFVRMGLRGWHKVFRNRGDYLVYPSGDKFLEPVKEWDMSKISALIIKGADFSAIKERRRANFRFLLERLSDDHRCTLPIRSLPEGVCPLLFPVIVPERDRIYRQLKSKGLSGYDWWGDFHPAVPWDDFSDAVYLKKNVFGFPVHQDVSIKGLEQFLVEFGNCLLS